MMGQARQLRETFSGLRGYLPVFCSHPYALQPSEFWAMSAGDFLSFVAHRDQILKETDGR